LCAFEVSLPAHRVRQGADAPGDVERIAELAGQDERPLVQAYGAFVVFPLVSDEPEFAQRSTLPFLVSHLPVHVQALLVQRHRAIVVTLRHSQDAGYLDQVRLRARGQSLPRRALCSFQL
jgi:hypothetical protein